jgi:hypothetical protein
VNAFLVFAIFYPLKFYANRDAASPPAHLLYLYILYDTLLAKQSPFCAKLSPFCEKEFANLRRRKQDILATDFTDEHRFKKRTLATEITEFFS